MEDFTVEYVAEHLGVTKKEVLRWTSRPTANFPSPTLFSRYGKKPNQREMNEENDDQFLAVEERTK